VASAILEALASNAIAASIVFLIAVGVTLCTRNAAARNLAWTLVLVKLVTPGIVPVPMWSMQQRPAVSTAAVARIEIDPIDRVHQPGREKSVETSRGDDRSSVRLRTFAGTARTVAAWTDDWFSPAACTLCVWFGGCAIVVLLCSSRVIRMRRLLSCAKSASDDVISEVSQMRELAGLQTRPQVLVVDARLGPFILPIAWRPALVLPRPLLETLDKHQRATLIAHELAHLRRRDHWIAWIELAAFALYWWLPIAWLARSFARRSSEDCCDGWVLRWLPNSGIAYADTLLKVLDFASPRLISPLDFTPTMGRFSLTKRRLAMILENKCRPELSLPLQLAAWPLCVAILLCAPTILRTARSDDAVRRPLPSERSAANVQATVADVAPKSAPKPPPREPDGNRAGSPRDAAADRSRQLARAVLQQNGKVTVRLKSGRTVMVDVAAYLPTDPVPVVGITLGDFSGVRSADYGNARPIDGSVLKKLAGSDELESVWLNLVNVADSGMGEFEDLTNLKSLVLLHCNLYGDGLSHLRPLQKLEHLSLDQNPISDESLRFLASLPNLRELSLLGTPISDKGIEHLSKLTSLRYVDLRGTKVTRAGAARLRKALPGCSTW
jgi:beta-lactamase regulating signal transducer with metallopeptidase domain